VASIRANLPFFAHASGRRLAAIDANHGRETAQERKNQQSFTKS
jgi:hypothetical protein